MGRFRRELNQLVDEDEVDRATRAAHIALSGFVVAILLIFGTLGTAGALNSTGKSWTLLLAFIPLVHVIYHFATRGGISRRLVGIELVQGDGRPAARWRCALRTFLFWLPLIVCSMICAYLAIVQDLALALLVPFVVPLFYIPIALWRPQRAPHDRIVGTHLVR